MNARQQQQGAKENNFLAQNHRRLRSVRFVGTLFKHNCSQQLRPSWQIGAELKCQCLANAERLDTQLKERIK
jgi:hypothetical protein